MHWSYNRVPIYWCTQPYTSIYGNNFKNKWLINSILEYFFREIFSQTLNLIYAISCMSAWVRSQLVSKRETAKSYVYEK